MPLRRELGLTLATVITMFAILVTGALATDYYVDASRPDNSGDGKSWANAWKTITYALTQVTTAGDNINVAAGLYDVTNNGESFPLIMNDGVDLLGAGAATTTIDAEKKGAKHVIVCGNVTNLTISGFTITGGKAGTDSSSNYTDAAGGGVLFLNCPETVKLTNCTVTGNTADGLYAGAGGIACIAAVGNCKPVIIECVITDNTVTGRGTDGAAGGGIGIGAYYYACSKAECSPTIEGCTIQGNTVEATEEDAYAAGGGIGIGAYQSGATCKPLIKGCTIGGDSAADANTVTASNGRAGGGGIAVLAYEGGACNPTIDNCTITSNTVNGEDAGSGGIAFGADNATCNGTVTGGSVSNNTVTASGSGDEDGGVAGGIGCLAYANATCTVEIKNGCTISGNTVTATNAMAAAGGIGVGSDGSGASCTVTVNGCTIEKNTVAGKNAGGGGMACLGYCGGTSTLTVEKCTVGGADASYGNTATASGTGSEDGATAGGIGALAYDGTCTLTIKEDCTISNNTVTADDSNAAAGGVGVGAYKDTGTAMCTATIEDSIIDHNTATGKNAGGGGIGCISAYGGTFTATIEECTVSNNGADGKDRGGAGGIGCYRGTATIRDCDIYDNWVKAHGTTYGGAGGIGLYSNSPRIEGCTISGNTVRITGTSEPAGAGGGIGCVGQTGTCSPTITDCKITNNTVTVSGTDAGAGGGGIACIAEGASGVCSPTIECCLVTSNSASASDTTGSFAIAGGIGLLGLDEGTCSPKVKDCLINKNTASDHDAGAGGIGCIAARSDDTKSCGTCEPDIFNCLIVENSATGSDASWAGGIGGLGVNASVDVASCTLSKNTATNGGGIGCAYGTVTVLNSILWGDTPDEVYTTGGGTVTVTYSDVEGGYGGQANIDDDPEFRVSGYDTACNGYFLDQADSPCINAGSGSAEAIYGKGHQYSTDPDGDPDDGQVDMGYHYKRHGCTYIELVSFEARPLDGSIVLTWETGAEIDNAGFVLFRKAAGSQDYVTSGKWTAHGPVSARLLIIPRPFMLPRTERVMVR